MNVRAEAVVKHLSTAMHLAVEINDYDAVKLILDYPGDPKREIGLKDNKGKNPMDLSVDLEFNNIKDLFQRYGGHQSSMAIQD